MSEGMSRTEQLSAELNERLCTAITEYAKKHGLSQEEVMETARSLLLNPSTDEQ